MMRRLSRTSMSSARVPMVTKVGFSPCENWCSQVREAFDFTIPTIATTLANAQCVVPVLDRPGPSSFGPSNTLHPCAG